MLSYSDHLRTARRDAGLTQAEVAEQADVSVRTVKRIEAGITAPSLPLAKRIADAVGVSLDSLFVHDQDATEPSNGRKQADNHEAPAPHPVNAAVTAGGRAGAR